MCRLGFSEPHWVCQTIKNACISDFGKLQCSEVLISRRIKLTWPDLALSASVTPGLAIAALWYWPPRFCVAQGHGRYPRAVVLDQPQNFQLRLGFRLPFSACVLIEGSLLRTALRDVMHQGAKARITANQCLNRSGKTLKNFAYEALGRNVRQENRSS